MSKSKTLTHVDDLGQARMIDVSAKAVTRRQAEAEGQIRMAEATLEAVRANTVRKGDVLAVAQSLCFIRF